jgi:hypothetical protein
MTEDELTLAVTGLLMKEAEREFVVIAGSNAPPLMPRLAREVVRLMRYAAEHAKVTTDLTTTGRVHYTHFVPGLPEDA